MRATSLDITGIRSHRRRWSQVKRGLAEWQHRIYSRGELMNLSDSSLRDIGLSRCSADVEASKLFWMA
jgi:uncharacterized protein YjiS (DUF1127 family)